MKGAFFDRESAARAVRLAMPMIAAAMDSHEAGDSGFLHVVVMNPLAPPGETSFEDAILYEHSVGEGIILDSPLDAGIPLCAVAAWRRGIRLPAALSVVGGRAGQATALVRAQAGAQGALLALSAEGDPEAGADPSEWSGLLPAGPADACGVPAVLRASAEGHLGAWRLRRGSPVGAAARAGRR